MPGQLMWGWDPTNKVWLPMIVNTAGKLVIASVEDAEISQDTPQSLKHVPHGYYAAGPSYLPLAVDSAGKLQLAIASLPKLDDIEDVSVSFPTNGHALYWDAATSLWKSKDVADYPMKLKPAITRYVIPGWFATLTATFSPTAGRIYYIPIFVTETTTYIGIGIYVFYASAGTADLRIFNWINGVPGSLALNAGTVNTGTTGSKVIAISKQLTRGYYFLAYQTTSTPDIQGLDAASAIATPCPGIYNSTNLAPAQIVLSVDAAYADPAPAPTNSETMSRVCVFLREN